MIHCVILLLKKGVLIYVMIILLGSLTKILQMKKSVKVAFFTLMNKAKKEQTACLPAFLSYFLTLLTFIAFNTTKTRISIFFLVLFSFSALALLSFIHMYIHNTHAYLKLGLKWGGRLSLGWSAAAPVFRFYCIL